MSRFSVVIAGGGVAALEALLRLRRLAADRVDITVVAPNADFAYRALSVQEPFSAGAPDRYELGPLIRSAGAEWVKDSLARVDTGRRVVHTESGGEVAFDALLIAIGATPQAVVPHARTFDDRHSDDLLRGVVQDIEQGYVKKLAFINPSGPVWPLPLVELALMSAQTGWSAGMDDMELHLITAEPRPLPAFGAEVGGQVEDLLREAGVSFHPLTEPDVVGNGHVAMPRGPDLQVDSVIAMPRLTGPAVKGIPSPGDHGFIKVNDYCEVPGTDRRVFAAGDAIDFPVKHGGVGSQAADVAAAAIARRAGVGDAVPPFRPVIHGKLLTGAGPKFLFARYIGHQGFDSTLSDAPLGSSAKVTAAELTPYLRQVGRAG